MRTATKFVNPKTGETYQWPRNHSEESPIQKSRQIGDGAPTSNIGLIPQQGVTGPLRFEWKGRMFTLAEIVATNRWWTLCDTQTIHLVDPGGAQYEVIITDFQPQRVRVAQNRWDPVYAPTWIWEYTIDMRVLTVISGEWLGVA